MPKRLSRRSMIKHAALAGAAGAVPAQVLAQTAPPDEAYANLAPTEARTLEAVVARLIPSDGVGPGALEAGAARYIDRALGDALAAVRGVYAASLAALDDYARSTEGEAFAELEPARQDAILTALEENRAPGFEPRSSEFFNLLLQHTLEGTFGDPHYGGNRDFIGWEMLAYPGLKLAVSAEEQRMNARPPLSRISAYDLPMFEGAAPAGGDGDRDDG